MVNFRVTVHGSEKRKEKPRMTRIKADEKSGGPIVKSETTEPKAKQPKKSRNDPKKVHPTKAYLGTRSTGIRAFSEQRELPKRKGRGFP